MTEEEIKAIRWLERIEFHYQPIILELIKKQQKEIEELKKDNENQWRHRCKMAIELDNNVISKDKIREKIKKYDKWIKDSGEYTESLEAQRYALNELLEE